MTSSARTDWQPLETDTFDDDWLNPLEQRLAETEPPVPKGGKRMKFRPPEPQIVRLEDVRR